MPSWVEPRRLEVQLYYGDLMVAELHRMFPHQGTWFAEYELSIAPGQGMLQDKLLDYIGFCEDFHRRMANELDHDFEEFDNFEIDSDSWVARLPSGVSIPIEGNMLFADGQSSWQHPGTRPEEAANKFWECNAPIGP